MAVAPLTPAEQERLLELEISIEETRKRISVINEKMATATGARLRNLQAAMATEKNLLKNNENQNKELKKREKYLDEVKSINKQILDISGGANKILNKTTDGYAAVAGISAEIIKRKEQELALDGDALRQSQEGTAAMESITAEVLRKSEELANIKHIQSENDKEIEKFQRSIAGLTGQAKIDAEAQLAIMKNLNQQLERTNALHEANHDLLHHMPGFIGDALDMAKKMVAQVAALGAPLVIMYALLGAALHDKLGLPMCTLDKGQSKFFKRHYKADFRNLGPLVTEMDVIRKIEGW